jgi:hypothetical protein
MGSLSSSPSVIDMEAVKTLHPLPLRSERFANFGLVDWMRYRKF